jgi:hypothetical protein
VTYVEWWARAFAFTVGVELAVAVPLLRETERSRLRRVGAVLFANLASHPAVWFVLPALGMPHFATLALAEAWAVGLEVLVYRLVFPDLPFSRALAVSALANGASFGTGELLRELTGWV